MTNKLELPIDLSFALGKFDNQEFHMQYSYRQTVSFDAKNGKVFLEIDNGNGSGTLSEIGPRGLEDTNKAFFSDGVYYSQNFKDICNGEITLIGGIDFGISAISLDSIQKYSNNFLIDQNSFIVNDGSVGGAIKYKNNNGWNAVASYASNYGNVPSVGIGSSSPNQQLYYLGYDAEEFGGGISTSRDRQDLVADVDYYGGGVYWKPKKIPLSLYMNYDKKYGSVVGDERDILIGSEYKINDKLTFSLAGHRIDRYGGWAYTQDFEAYFNYKLHDYITLTPGFFLPTGPDRGTRDDAGFAINVRFTPKPSFDFKSETPEGGIDEDEDGECH